MFRNAYWGMCFGISSSSIQKSLSKDYPQNPLTQGSNLTHFHTTRSAHTQLGPGHGAEPDSESENGHVEQLYEYYVREMWYISITHTLVDVPDVRLKEEAVLEYDSCELCPVTVALGQQDGVAR